MSSFDRVASSYDDTFTHSSIGRLQRSIVHDYISTALEWPVDYVLEMGCGTGEDLLYFGSRAKHIDAFDLSKPMIDIARTKIKSAGSSINVFHEDLKNWVVKPAHQIYDLIFSNFGVLNCLDPSYFQDFHTKCSESVASKGSVILVIMPRHCLMEKLYFLSKGKWSEINRRSKYPQNLVLLEGSPQATWYYDPGFIRRHFTDFRTVKILPVGLSIPPSYLQDYFDRKPNGLNNLHQLDKRLRNLSLFSRFADHFLIHLVKK